MPVDMSEDVDTSVDQQPPTEPQGPVCGERLAEARRAQQITVLEIAKELHLDEPKVRALEHNDFNVLGAPVFAKGHLRKYAQLVGVDVDDVVADYYRLTRQTGMPPVVTGRPPIKQELSPGPWIAGIIILLAVALGYWLLVMRTAPPVTIESDPAVPQPQSVTPAREERSSQDKPVLLASGVLTDTVANDEAPADVVPATPSSPLRQTIDSDQMHVTLSFSGECWTEISDADGRRLFFDMGSSGRNIELSGRPPFSVLFGNVENVSVRVNGTDFTIPDADRSGRTARLTLLGPRPSRHQ